ncbi:MAG: GIY-YIG nuclease family protein [Terrimicrobiaceae bacterium]
MMTYKVYIIKNPIGKLYIGLSENVAVRVRQHNEGQSRWTKNKGPWSLIWMSEGMSLSEARRLENKLKRQKGGDGLAILLKAHNPAAAGS